MVWPDADGVSVQLYTGRLHGSWLMRAGADEHQAKCSGMM